MTQFAAWFFRSFNAHIITTRFEWVRKPLKVLFLLSEKVKSRSLKKSDGKRHWEIIQNFDRDIRLKVDRSRSMGASLYWTGLHELREFIFLHRYLKKEMVALDVGANLGEYTMFMAKRLTEVRVLSFEPMELVRSQLQENVRLNNLTMLMFLILVYPTNNRNSNCMRWKMEMRDSARFFLGIKRAGDPLK